MVLAQVQRLRDELGAGVLDLVVGGQLSERTLHSIELFGAKVLCIKHDLNSKSK